MGCNAVAHVVTQCVGASAAKTVGETANWQSSAALHAAARVRMVIRVVSSRRNVHCARSPSLSRRTPRPRDRHRAITRAWSQGRDSERTASGGMGIWRPAHNRTYSARPALEGLSGTHGAISTRQSFRAHMNPPPPQPFGTRTDRPITHQAAADTPTIFNASASATSIPSMAAE